MSKNRSKDMALNLLEQSTKNNLSIVSNEELIDMLFNHYKLKDKDKISTIVGDLIKSELINRLARLTRADNTLKDEVKAADDLFKLIEELTGVSFGDTDSEAAIDKLATTIAYQFKNLIIYREFIRAIFRYITLDEDLGIINLAILKDAQTEQEQVDYNYIKEIIKQISKEGFDSKNAAYGKADTKDIC